MGVHNTDVYPEIKKLLDIPEDEPIFILRGKDRLAARVIDEYLYMAGNRGCTTEFTHDLDKVQNEFDFFAHNNPDLMKLPD